MIEDDLRLLHAVLVEAVHQNTDSLTVNSVQGVPRVPQDVEEQFDVVLVPVDDQVVQLVDQSDLVKKHYFDY